MDQAYYTSQNRQRIGKITTIVGKSTAFISYDQMIFSLRKMAILNYQIQQRAMNFATTSSEGTPQFLRHAS
jgi:hypothetical protein